MGKKSRKLKKIVKWVLEKLFALTDFIFSFLEVHLAKIVAFSIMCLCCFSVSVLHMIVVIMLLICLLFGMSALQFSFSFIGPYLSVLFISKMAYQTDFVPKFELNKNCSEVNITISTIIANTILDPEWWGYEELENEELIITYYKGYILVFLVMTLQGVIRTRQKITRIDAGLSPDVPDVMFPKTTRKQADKSLRHCLKFFFNYGFYKFGIEITLTYCVFVIGYREDVFSILYAVWICILVLPKRTTLTVLWPFFLTTVLFSILWQYSMAVGFSNKTCFEYPWVDQDILKKWLFLPCFTNKPNTKKTLVDFVLLVFIQRQQEGFELEKKFGDRHYGGNNREEYKSYASRDFVNPYPDHTLGVRSWIDFAKLIFLSWFLRITLACMFWSGASDVSVLSLGYLVGAFLFLWIGYDLCLWNIEKILKWWNAVLIFGSVIILLKAILEFVGCIFGKDIQVTLSFFVGPFRVECCELNTEQTPHSFDWDIVCFFCLIIQRRLQAKGAKLIDELQELRFKEFQERERRTLMKIKKNMNRIKAWQKRMQGLNYSEPTSHETAIYMGDYFMFEDVDKVDLKISSSSSDEDERYHNMSELLNTVFKRQDDQENDGSVLRQRKGDVRRRRLESEREKSLSPKKRDSKRDRYSTESSDEASKTEIEEKEEEGKKNRLRSVLVEALIFLISFFNKYSKDYRQIQRVIQNERRKRKTKPGDDVQDNADVSSTSLRRRVSLGERSQSLLENEEDDEDYHKKSLQKLLMRALAAFAKFFMSKTELFCYLSIFFHALLSPSLISLVLPMMVFLWGSLTAVRPSTTFWTVLIAYTEIMVIIKALFQNLIFPWNSIQKKATHFEYPPLFLGIHKDNQFILADLALLLLLFLHRYKLKSMGLWNRAHEEETFLPEDLKVYTELSSENELRNIKGNRSVLNQRSQRKLVALPSETSSPIGGFLQKPFWKCTSKATAKLVYRGDKCRAKIAVKEMEGLILVTHDGRRLQPTHAHVSHMTEGNMEGNVVLRVYTNDIALEIKTLANKLCWIQHFTSIRKFFLQILVRDWCISADYYTLMFIFQFMNFLIIFFGYSSFANPDDIQSDDYFILTENQVPAMYLFTIISHFLVIIIDRILYLRKCIVGKLILHFTLVISIHIWMFIIIPIVTEGFFNRLIIRQIYYLICCLYFLMSAYQLRVGYPMRVQGHFLSKRYGYINYYAYKGLQFLPFFNQLRTLLDYLCTHTSLSIGQWIKMESIFEVVFENKCSRRADIYYPSARGQECPKCSKYWPGIFSFAALFVIIWLPFIIFAVFNTVAQPNLPQDAALELHIGNFGNIYVSVASFNDIITFTKNQYNWLQNIYKDNKKLWTFLSLYDSRDMAVLKFRFEPFQPWSITPKEFAMLNETVQNLDLPVSIYLILVVQRIPRSQIVATAKGYSETVLRKNDEARKQLADAFLKKGNPVRLNNALPKFVHVTNEGKALAVSGFMTPPNVAHRNITITLQEENGIYWWKLKELADDENEYRINKIPFQSKTETTIYTFNEKNTPKFLLNVRKKGIIGLYLSIVLVTWTFTRRIMLKYPKLMFEEMPNPDPVLQLCQDIYLARESHEFALEEDLYAKLLFLFRSPETMIKVTRLTTVEVRT